MVGVLFNTFALYKIFIYEGLDVKKRHLILFLACNLAGAAISLTYIFFRGMYCLTPYILCAFWLACVAYADHVTCNVYEIMEYYAVIPIMLTAVNIISNGMENILPKLAAVLVTVTVYDLMAKFRIYGEGDGDVLSVVCAVYFDAYYNCIFFCLVMIVFVLLNFRYVIKKNGGSGGVRPLIPSIYLGYILMLPFVQAGIRA